MLVPINSYFRELWGDSDLLPFLPQMSLATLEPNEVLFTNSKDMMSCFHLFKMPDCWAGYFAFGNLFQRVRSGVTRMMLVMCICEL